MNQETYDVIDKNSLFRLNISREYLGEINIKNASKQISKETILEIPALHHNITRTYLVNDVLITVLQIEGITFDASPIESNGNPDRYKPNLGSGGQEHADTGNPVCPFEIRPPKDRNMYGALYFRKGVLSSAMMCIASKAKNETQTKIYRAPIPNSNESTGTLCLGNMHENSKPFSTDFTEKYFYELIHGGWNSDWWRNSQEFIEKNGIFHNFWTTAVGLDPATIEISQEHESIRSIINELEERPIHRLKRERQVRINPNFRHTPELPTTMPTFGNRTTTTTVAELLDEAEAV